VRVVPRALALGACLAAGGLLFAPSASADSATVGVAGAAWYSPPPSCALPTGCGPTDSLPPASVYPAGTLHVGVRAGVEEARTYLKLDLESLPADAKVTGVTLTLPVAPGDAGTVDAADARMVACWLPHSFTPASGSAAPPPEVDCSTSADAVPAGGEPSRFTVDLRAFAARWASGEANNGLALVPAPRQAPGATWHVALYAPASQGTPPTAQVAFDAAGTPAAFPVPADGGLGPAVGPPSASPGGEALSSAPPASAAAPILEQAHAPAALPPSPQAQLVTQTFPRFAYPVVMGLPLVLLLLGGYLGRALTRPLDPVDSSAAA